MAEENLDPVTGRTTTGHEWNGIEELDTPVPRVVFFFLWTTVLFSVIYWILMPAWPLGVTYTKGLLGYDQRDVVMQQVQDAADARAIWASRLATEDLSSLAEDPELMRHVEDTGRTLFIDNCAVCHGVTAEGGPGYPNLTDGTPLWGRDAEVIAETIRVGINSSHDETRFGQMMAFGRDGLLDRADVSNVSAYVRSLSGQPLSDTEQMRVAQGAEVFAENCASCHGAEAKGDMELGAPDLTDNHWVYGGDAQSVYRTIFFGRQGHMPHWEERLRPAEINTLALYVASLGEKTE
jgi:cytochrome c oxidase cbb3-type subunit 3